MINHIKITESALERIRKLLLKQPYGTVFRISVSGGGCSGFSYEYGFKSSPEEGDITLSQEGITIAIDAMSLPYIENSVLEFVDDLMGTYFRMNNPKATASCGCGTSFSVF